MVLLLLRLLLLLLLPPLLLLLQATYEEKLDQPKIICSFPADAACALTVAHNCGVVPTFVAPACACTPSREALVDAVVCERNGGAPQLAAISTCGARVEWETHESVASAHVNGLHVSSPGGLTSYICVFSVDFHFTSTEHTPSLLHRCCLH
jgi:hypothetical protein